MNKLIKGATRSACVDLQVEAMDTTEQLLSTMDRFIKRDEKIDLQVEPMDMTEDFDGTFALGRRLAYSCIKDNVLIHIYEYETVGDREILTMDGLCFTPRRLTVLMSKIREIDEVLWRQNISKVPKIYKVQSGDVVYRAHLGAGVYVSVDKTFNGVDLRRHWVPEGQLTIVPSKDGINMPTPQWNSFKQKLNDLLSLHPELFDAKECFHEFSLDIIDCKECLPFGLLCL